MFRLTNKNGISSVKVKKQNYLEQDEKDYFINAHNAESKQYSCGVVGLHYKKNRKAKIKSYNKLI